MISICKDQLNSLTLFYEKGVAFFLQILSFLNTFLDEKIECFYKQFLLVRLSLKHGMWNTEMLEYWNVVMLEYWNAGILEC